MKRGGNSASSWALVGLGATAIGAIAYVLFTRPKAATLPAAPAAAYGSGSAGSAGMRPTVPAPAPGPTSPTQTIIKSGDVIGGFTVGTTASYDCEQLKVAAARAWSQGHITEGDSYKEQAKIKGCAWAL